ncbi:protoporphyrinogen oxidase [Halalkalibacter nanhaiisediminis]|uniref:Coproporphyrinogen III oxidase n=1 Tax=Halalkalibacter nanhaiisediminis TaxID=688079 RepID=A0A562QHK5_9BACI|nr:protoporphyrinogen oxidase [Halalkalibacter nanhaiisediminis]TWI56237.1 oxygen-dependent protoporphyrinogen oxidase [Halalkalibacter nanhaiisediminis]
MTNQNKRVAIIGGGITGLAAAHKLELAKAEGISIEYDLFEKSDRLGGKIQTEYVNGFVIERGPDSYLARKQSMSRLAKAVGMEEELLANDTGQAYILKDDRLHPIPAGAVMGVPTEIQPFLTTKLFSPIGKLRAAGDFFISRTSSRDEDISLGHFFRHRLGDEVVDHLIEPLLSGIYAGDLNKLSLKATFPQFQQMEAKHGSLIKGMKASRAQQPKPIAEKPKGMFLTFRNGLQSFVQAIENHLDADSIHKEADITSIQKEDDQYRLQFANGESLLFDEVIITTPPHVTARLLSSYSYFHYLKEMEVTTVATVALGFKKEAVHNPYEGTGFVVSRKSKHTITACTWTHKKWRHSTPEGHALLRSYVGRAGDSAIVERSDEEIVEAVLHDLKQIMDINGDPEFYRVTRWKKAMPQYNVGHTYKMAKIKEDVMRNLPGLHLCGAGFEGVGLPDCIDQGEAAVSRILKG